MSWNDGLAPEQAEAASHHGSHARLLAGPGTGKTKTLTARILYLIENQGVSPSSILALTFTRAAAAELRRRVASSLDEAVTEQPKVATLHSYALQTILQHGAGNRIPSPIRIADDYEERWIIQEDIKGLLGLREIGDAQELLGQLSADWERLSVDGDDWAARFPNPRFIGQWQEHRAIYGYTLRAELVYQLKRGLEEGQINLTQPPSHLLVDEYQDLNACDLAIIKALAECGSEIFGAGDDDQSIYGFRYANPVGIRNFLEEYNPAANLTLTECRRCGQRILDYAEYVANQDPRRIPKELAPSPNNPPGDVRLLCFANENDEIRGITSKIRDLINNEGLRPDDILILLRSDRGEKFSSPLKNALIAIGVPCSNNSDPLCIFNLPPARLVLSFIRILANPQDSLAWRTLLQLRQNRIGDIAITRIYEIARTSGLTFQAALEHIRDNPQSVERQGNTIRNGILELEGMLATFRDAAQNGLENLIQVVVNTTIDDAAQRTAILNSILSAIAPLEITNVEHLLQVLNSSLGNVEQSKNPGQVSVMTMHQAKGLDAKAVFIVAAEDEIIPGTARQVEDERRLLYVSLTRAKSHLYITYCQRRLGEQRHTGARAGNPNRTLTRFLSGGPLRPEQITWV